MVRSQSERVIAEWFLDNNIRFEYERVVGVRNYRGNPTWRLPDFYLPDYGVYWEHFGRWDDEEYRIRARRKLAMYHEAGLRVICTFGYPPSPRLMQSKLAPYRQVRGVQ